MKHILKCSKCETFTMEKKCECGGEAITTKPQKYSPQKFAKYRQKAKKEKLIQEGLL